MQIITPSVELWKHDIHPYEFMEKVGRVCYKSEDKITEGSAVKMMNALKKSKHYAILEHEHLYFEMSERFMNSFLAASDYFARKYYDNHILKYFNITNDTKYDVYVLSGSFRSFLELFEKGYASPTFSFIEIELQKEYFNKYLDISIKPPTNKIKERKQKEFLDIIGGNAYEL
jgi:thymidylate synthase (FAD)